MTNKFTLVVLRYCFIFGIILTTVVSKNHDIREADNTFTTVIDILSANADFSTFLLLVQKNGYVSYLNEMNDFTLFAPINSAFTDSERGLILNQDINIQETNEKLGFDIENYILHNFSLNTKELNEKNNNIHSYINVFDPLKYSNKLTYLFKKNINDFFTKTTKAVYDINEISIIEANLTPNFQNAIIHAISNKIVKPLNLVQSIEKLSDYDIGVSNSDNSKQKINNNFEFIYQLFNREVDKSKFIDYSKDNTVLLPSDNNFLKVFNSIEINYLLDYFNRLSKSEDDLNPKMKSKWMNDRDLLVRNLILNTIIGGNNLNSTISNSFDVTKGHSVFNNLNNQKLNISSNEVGSVINVNNSSSSIANVLFDSGILHTFDDLNFIDYNLRFNTEKYLHGLNKTEFVDELYLRNMQHLILDDNMKSNLTIFIPEANLYGFTKANLLYHFTDDRILLEEEFSQSTNEMNTKLFDSSFCSSNKKLGSHCQRFKITKSNEGYFINDRYQILHSKPYEIGNHLIYIMSNVLQLPGDLILSINPFYHCETSLKFLRQLDLLELDNNKKGYSVFLPCFDAWSEFELNYEYINNNVTAQELIMKNLIINDLIYSDTSNKAVFETTNLLDEKVSIYASNLGRNNNLSLNISSIEQSLSIEKNLDIFFNQGVIHPIANIYLPGTVEITVKNLIGLTKTTEFSKFLDKFEEKIPILNNKTSYSLLVPSASSLELEGIFSNFTKLEDFLKLHIIPGNFTNNILNCNGEITTLSGDKLSCDEFAPNNYLLKLDDENDKAVRIIKKGCSTSDSKSCVFLIDRPISLKWLSRHRYHINLPGVAIGLGILVGVIFIFSLLGCILVLCMGRSNQKTIYHPVESGDIENDTQPLLSPDNIPPHTLHNNHGSVPHTGSSPAMATPIRMPTQ